MGWYPRLVRPITNEEFELMREYCVEEAYNFLVKWETKVGRQMLSRFYGIDPEHYYHLIVESYKFDTPCIYGKYWYQLGWGEGNPKLNTELSNFETCWIKDKLYTDIDGKKYLLCDDGLRVGNNYPHKIIHNKKELRRYLRKKYFNLSEETHKILSDLWAKYPGTILCWG